MVPFSVSSVPPLTFRDSSSVWGGSAHSSLSALISFSPPFPPSPHYSPFPPLTLLPTHVLFSVLPPPLENRESLFVFSTRLGSNCFFHIGALLPILGKQPGKAAICRIVFSSIGVGWGGWPQIYLAFLPVFPMCYFCLMNNVIKMMIKPIIWSPCVLGF